MICLLEALHLFSIVIAPLLDILIHVQGGAVLVRRPWAEGALGHDVLARDGRGTMLVHQRVQHMNGRYLLALSLDE